MATLVNQDESKKFQFKPYRISEKGTPTWVSAQIILESDNKKIVDDTLSVTLSDLEELANRIHDLISKNIKEFEVVTSDDDFVIKGYFQSDNLFLIEITIGEKNRKYYKLVVDGKTLNDFFEKLRIDRVNLKPKGELP